MYFPWMIHIITQQSVYLNKYLSHIILYYDNILNKLILSYHSVILAIITEIINFIKNN